MRKNNGIGLLNTTIKITRKTKPGLLNNKKTLTLKGEWRIEEIKNILDEINKT